MYTVVQLTLQTIQLQLESTVGLLPTTKTNQYDLLVLILEILKTVMFLFLSRYSLNLNLP